jgi:hypothetical protein
MMRIVRVLATRVNINDDLYFQTLQKLRSVLHAKRSGKNNINLPHDKTRPDTARLCVERI